MARHPTDPDWVEAFAGKARARAREALSAFRLAVPEVVILDESSHYLAELAGVAERTFSGHPLRLLAVRSETEVLASVSQAALMVCIRVDSTGLGAHGAFRRILRRAPYAVPVAVGGDYGTSVRTELRTTVDPLFFDLGEAVRFLPSVLEIAATQRQHLARALEDEAVALEVVERFDLRTAAELGYVPPPPPPASVRRLDEVERDALAHAVRAAENNRTVAARLLGVSRGRLYRMLEKYGELFDPTTIPSE